MLYRPLGNTGYRISAIGLGANRFGADHVPQTEVNAILDAALDLGITHVDTANIYTATRSEETIGNALKGRRERFFIATKVGMPAGKGPNETGVSRGAIFTQVEASLRRLQSEYIDLYYVHRWDPNTPIAETLRALDDLVRSGKVRYLGASNFAAYQLAHANLLAETQGWERFAVIQAEYSLVEREMERELIPCCRDHQVGMVPYFPLAGGFLTGKYQRNQPAPKGSRGESSPYVQKFMTEALFTLIEKLSAWAGDHGRGLNELAIAWLLAQPQVSSVIAGATRCEQVLNNASAADWELSADEVKEINAILAQ